MGAENAILRSLLPIREPAGTTSPDALTRSLRHAHYFIWSMHFWTSVVATSRSFIAFCL